MSSKVFAAQPPHSPQQSGENEIRSKRILRLSAQNRSEAAILSFDLYGNG